MICCLTLLISDIISLNQLAQARPHNVLVISYHKDSIYYNSSTLCEWYITKYSTTPSGDKLQITGYTLAGMISEDRC